MFIKYAGERFNVLLHGDMGAWVISYDSYQMPVYLEKQLFYAAERISAPEEYVINKSRVLTDAQRKRYDMLRPVINDIRCVTDGAYRSAQLKEIASKNKTTVRRLSNLYYLYLSHGCFIHSKPKQQIRNREFDDAIKKYYFFVPRCCSTTLENLSAKFRRTAEITSTVIRRCLQKSRRCF